MVIDNKSLRRPRRLSWKINVLPNCLPTPTFKSIQTVRSFVCSIRWCRRITRRDSRKKQFNLIVKWVENVESEIKFSIIKKNLKLLRIRMTKLRNIATTIKQARVEMRVAVMTSINGSSR